MDKQEIDAMNAFIEFFHLNKDKDARIILSIFKSLKIHTDIDYSSLAEYLNEVNQATFNDKKYGYLDKENYLEVSRKHNDSVFVKAITETKRPIIMFMKEDGGVIFKIRQLEKNGVKYIATENSNGEYGVDVEKLENLSTKNMFYSHKENYEIAPTYQKCTTGTYAKTGKNDEPFSEEMLCDDYKNFYLFLKNIFKQNNIDVADLTVAKSDFIFAVFYQKFKDLCMNGCEFAPAELVALLDVVLCDGKSGLSSIANGDSSIDKSKYNSDVLEIIEHCYQNRNKKTVSMKSKADDTTIRFTTYDKNLIINLFKESDSKPKVNFWISKTDKGFTLFMGVLDNEMLAGTKRPKMMTLSMGKDTLSLRASADSENSNEATTMHSMLKFLKDGQLLIATENTESSGTVPKKNKEQIIEEVALENFKKMTNKKSEKSFDDIKSHYSDSNMFFKER